MLSTEYDFYLMIDKLHVFSSIGHLGRYHGIVSVMCVFTSVHKLFIQTPPLKLSNDFQANLTLYHTIQTFNDPEKVAF